MNIQRYVEGIVNADHDLEAPMTTALAEKQAHGEQHGFTVSDLTDLIHPVHSSMCDYSVRICDNRLTRKQMYDRIRRAALSFAKRQYVEIGEGSTGDPITFHPSRHN